MPMLAFTDIGKAIADNHKGFNFDQKVTIVSKTADGIALTITGINKETATDLSLKTAYATKSYAIDATIGTSDKVAVNASYSDLAPGLKLTGSVNLPDTSSGKLGVDYANPYVNVKSSVGLTSAPKVDLAAATGYSDRYVFGAQVAYDTNKSAVTSWQLATGYHRLDSQFAAYLTDLGETLKLVAGSGRPGAHFIGAEVARRLATGATTFTVGHTRTLSNGATTKYKLDNSGALSVLYEQRLSTGEKVGLSALVDVANVSSKPIKYGFAFDLA